MSASAPAPEARGAPADPEPPLYLLDTGILFTLVRGDAPAKALERRFGLSAARQRPLVSVVTHGEVWVLAARNGWGQARRDALANALRNLVTVDVVHAPPALVDAYVHLDIVSRAYPKGARHVGKNDLWIAATARATDATLLTFDRDLEHLIPGEVRGHVIDQQNPSRDVGSGSAPAAGATA